MVYVSEANYQEVFYPYVTEMARGNMKDSDYGLPSKKKYPMPDEKHVKLAIKFFNYVSKEDEAELARNINKKIKEFDMKDINVGEKNRFKEYYKPLNEAGLPDLKEIPTKCPYCKSTNIGTKFLGEPIIVCNSCNKNIGVAPFTEAVVEPTTSEYPIGYIFKESGTSLMSLEEKFKRKRR